MVIWLLCVVVCLIILISMYRDVRYIEKRMKNAQADAGGGRRARYRIDADISAMYHKISSDVKQQYEDEMLTKQAELSALQSQINPHFLYNTLDSIQGQALRNHNMEIAEMTAALSSFFRYSISMKNSIVTVADEIKNVKNYILIQKYRFGDKINLVIQCEDNDIMKCRVPQMILQPVVENAVYHGLERISRDGKVTLHFSCTPELLHIVVEDNGVGMSPEMTQQLNERMEQSGLVQNSESGKKGGIALRNVNQRIKLLYGEDYGIHVLSAQGIGTRIVLYLPAVKEGQDETAFGQHIRSGEMF